MSTNPSPQPPTDLTQLLLSVLGYNADSDITQAIVTDYQSPTGETLTLSESTTTTDKTTPYAYDLAGYSLWGFSEYG
jgi:hypothetical protein